MRKLKDVLRLIHEAGLGQRQVARSLNLSPSTVGEYRRRAALAGLTWPLPEGLDDAALEQRVFPPPDSRPAHLRPLPVWAEVHAELKRRKGVTLALLWEEYKAIHPEGLQYSRFCDHYRAWAGRLDLVMRQTHRAGEKLFVDWAGQTVPVVSRTTGEVRAAQIFVAVLGASSYTYAEATWTQTLPDWIGAHTRTLGFLGGSPEILVPDNPRTGIDRACRYDPDVNATYAEWAAHYGVAVIPARVRKPRDKAKVEVGVQIVERWVLAALRNRTFFSLAELNAAIRTLLERINQRTFKKLPGSRRSLFETLDRPALRPLPANPYVFAEWSRVRVHIDYHVEVDHHYYSVPHPLVGKQLDARASACPRSRSSTRGPGSRATCARAPAGATPPCPSTCPRPTGATPNGRPSAWCAGRRRPVPRRPRRPRPSSPLAPTPSRAFVPVRGSFAWARAMARPVWRRPAPGRSPPAPSPTGGSPTSSKPGLTASLPSPPMPPPPGLPTTTCAAPSTTTDFEGESRC
jgi:transposase